MNPFRSGDHLVANCISTAAVVVLVGTLVTVCVAKKPSIRGLQANYDKQKFTATLATTKAKQRITEITLMQSSQTWGANAQEAGWAAMASVTDMARKRNLRLISFRPQKANPIGDLTILPFLINVDGSFPNVVAFAHDLESTPTKLAPNMVQVASADPASDRVTANIGVVAFLNTPSSATGTTKATKEAPRGKGS